LNKWIGVIKGKILPVLLLVISIAVVLLIKSSADNSKQTLKIPVLSKSYQAGMQIVPEDIKMVEVGKFNLDSRIIKEKTELVKKYTIREIKEGQYIYTTDLSKEKTVKALMQEIKYGAISVNTNLTKCVGGIPEPLSWVKVLVVKQNAEEKKVDVIQYPELSAIKVLSIQDQVGQNYSNTSNTQKTQPIMPNNNQDKPAIVTFDARPEQVSRLLEGEYGGQIHLIMLPKEYQDDAKQEKIYKERLDAYKQAQITQNQIQGVGVSE
jgi:Flp pilus assembly protein CpaB